MNVTFRAVASASPSPRSSCSDFSNSRTYVLCLCFLIRHPSSRRCQGAAKDRSCFTPPFHGTPRISAKPKLPIKFGVGLNVAQRPSAQHKHARPPGCAAATVLPRAREGCPRILAPSNSARGCGPFSLGAFEFAFVARTICCCARNISHADQNRTHGLPYRRQSKDG